MKTLLCALALVFPVSALAATLEWDRNGENDMKDYQVWACFLPNCTVLKLPGNLMGVVSQPAVGVKPSFALDLADKEGTISVSARDLSTNESGLSVPLNFDKVAPLTPANTTLR